MLLRSRRRPPRSWPRFRSDVRPDGSLDRNRNTIPTDLHHAGLPLRIGNRAGEHVTIVDMPAFLTGIVRSAAGEFRHSPSNSGIEGVGKRPYSLGLKVCTERYAGTTGRYALRSSFSSDGILDCVVEAIGDVPIHAASLSFFASALAARLPLIGNSSSTFRLFALRIDFLLFVFVHFFDGCILVALTGCPSCCG